MSSEGSDKSANAADGANALLGDLESIRTLLSEEEEAAADQTRRTHTDHDEGADPSVATHAEETQPGPAASSPPEPDTATARDEEVPLLEDVVSGALGVHDLAEPHPSDMDDTPGAGSGLDDELFRVLLGEDWREAAAGILDQARAAIESRKLQWLPEDTDALNDALRVRIDETLQRWLREAVLAGMDDLRAELLNAITDQLETSVRQHLQTQPSDEDPNGK